VPDTNGYERRIHAGRPHSDASGRREFVLFHLPSGKIVGRFSDDDSKRDAAFLSPDGRRLATADGAGSSALIWDVAVG